MAPATPLSPERLVRTICPYCGVGCQIELHTEGRLVYRLSAPFDALPNRGRLCVKGRYGYDYLWHPDRLAMPLIRRSGQLEPVSWDDALSFVTSRLAATKVESGPGAGSGSQIPRI